MARKPDTRTGSRHTGTAKSFRFTDAELELLNEAAPRHGGQKGAIIAGLRALAGRNVPSNAELVEMVRVRLALATELEEHAK